MVKQCFLESGDRNAVLPVYRHDIFPARGDANEKMDGIGLISIDRHVAVSTGMASASSTTLHIWHPRLFESRKQNKPVDIVYGCCRDWRRLRPCYGKATGTGRGGYGHVDLSYQMGHSQVAGRTWGGIVFPLSSASPGR